MKNQNSNEQLQAYILWVDQLDEPPLSLIHRALRAHTILAARGVFAQHPCMTLRKQAE